MAGARKIQARKVEVPAQVFILRIVQKFPIFVGLVITVLPCLLMIPAPELSLLCSPK
jgi:fucose permease